MADGGEGLQASISGSVEVAGDAVMNNRKNKLIPAYELDIKGGWAGMRHASPCCITKIGEIHDDLVAVR